MSAPVEEKLPNDKIESVNIGLRRFDKGVYTLLDDSNMPLEAATEAVNLFQREDGRWGPRWGTEYYGTDLGATIDGADFYVTDDNDTHMVAVAGGTAYRSTDDGVTWEALTGQSFTAGEKCDFEQIASFLYIVNGTDAIARYNGTTTLQTYTALTTVTGIGAVESSLTGSNFTYYYNVVAVNDVGFTAGGTEASVNVALTRDDWDGSADKVTVSWTAVAGANRYEVYAGDTSGQTFFLGSTTGLSFIDNGSIAINSFRELPNDNTTTGPKFAHIALSGNRIWGAKDTDNPWRVHGGGTGAYQGFFSAFYGGFWIDIERGGRERVQNVIHGQDGKGNTFATVYTSDKRGLGSVWHIDVQTLEVGGTSFSVPVPTKIVGAQGTSAPYSIASDKQRILYLNTKGAFANGPKPQLLNLLSTDSLTGNIQPTIDAITGSAISKAAGIVYDNKWFLSVPSGSAVNNQTMVLDLQRNNWSTQAYSIGFERFLDYTDTDGKNHLLGWMPGGTQLVRTAKDVQGDFGAAFQTSYTSPLIHVTKDRIDFAKIQEVYIELGRPVGIINFTVYGQGQDEEFQALAEASITGSRSGVGWGNFLFGTTMFGDTSSVPEVFAQSSVKKVLDIDDRLNTIQLKIETNSKDAEYTLQMLRFQGIVIPTQPPSSWEFDS